MSGGTKRRAAIEAQGMTGKSKLFGLRRPGAALVCGGLAPLSYATFNPLGRGISGLDQSGAGPPSLQGDWSCRGSFPLDRAGRFGADVVDDAVNTFHFGNYPR